MYITTVLLLLIFSGTGLCHAQGQRAFEEKNLESYRNDSRYDYGPEPLPKKKEARRPTKKGDFNAGEIGKWIMYAIIGIAFVLIAGLLIRHYGNFRRPNRSLIGNDLTDLDQIEDIEGLNFGQKIIEAEKAANFRLAVRWHFLRALKKMNERNMITWQKNKTNRDYYFEISNPVVRDQFDKISMVFDHVWYGDFPTSEANYKGMQAHFQNFINLIK